LLELHVCLYLSRVRLLYILCFVLSFGELCHHVVGLLLRFLLVDPLLSNSQFSSHFEGLQIDHLLLQQSISRLHVFHVSFELINLRVQCVLMIAKLLIEVMQLVDLDFEVKSQSNFIFMLLFFQYQGTICLDFLFFGLDLFIF